MAGISFSGVFILDFYSIMFSFIVLFISSIIFFYSKYYIDEDKNQLGFRLLLVSFVISMLFLIFSPNIIILLLGWDGLGLTSFLLVIYYIRFSSSVAGIVTFLTNRLGDVFFLYCIAFMFFLGDWDFYAEKFSFLLLSLFLMGSFITKRAQVPFSSWLPMAMAAPTPVSSLVHSSTLVTAGVFLLIRFNRVILSSSILLLVLSGLTLMMSGIMANFEWDLKKLIALSTLSQLGFMVFSYSIGLVFFSFFHLIRHALFKASLFIRSGVMIHSIDNSQEFRNSGLFTQVKPLLSMAVVVCLLCLCGFPFTSGFYSKDLILDGRRFSLFFLFFFFFSVFLTISYSLRFSWYLFLSRVLRRVKLFYFYEVVFFLIVPIWLLVFCSLILGSFIFEYFFSLVLNYLFLGWKLFYFSFFFFFLLLSLLFFRLFFFRFRHYFLRTMWFLNKLVGRHFSKMFLSWGILVTSYIDQGYMEYFGPQGFNYFFSGLRGFFFRQQSYYFYLFFFFIFIFIFV